MRLLKDKENNFQPFYVSLTDISREGQDYQASSTPAKGAGNLLEKYSYLVQNIMSFDKQINSDDSLLSISQNLKLALKRIIPVKECNLFLFDESRASLIPFDKVMNQPFTSMVNNVYKEGILDWIFENAKPALIPEVNNFTVSGPKFNYLFYPIFENKKRIGLLAILSTISKFDNSDFEFQSIQLILNLCLARIEKITLKENLNTVYSELQTYQAKLRNDFRLSAIGELTEGIVEDIKTPLQVILSYSDLLGKNETESKAANMIKDQVRKINALVNRLIKFSNINEEKINIYPCDINAVINEYYQLVKSSMENAGIECVLDFEKEIPPVLSHQTWLFQLLSNIFSIIKSNCAGGGGLIIQSRYAAEMIVIKIINTANITINSSDTNQSAKSPNVNFRIIENIMKSHEGEFRVESFYKNSSVIELRFPLRRKNRK